ncbi:TfuA-like protein [Streptomyces sp. NPDC001118]
MTITVFAGPTIPAETVRALVPAAELRPPIAHGDLWRTGLGPGDTALILDGVWHQSVPVLHKEILAALDAGVSVMGAASMGALRAAELHPYGMTGIGAVYEAFRDGRLDADDEVAVLQGPTGRAVTTALVDVRACLAAARRSGRIGTAEETALVALARALPYTRRSWRALGRQAYAAGWREAYDRAYAWQLSHPFSQKQADAEQALRVLAHAERPAPPSSAWFWRAEPWATSYVPLWQAAYSPLPGSTVPLTAVLQHQQLYDPAFPDRWRSRVLAHATGRPSLDLHALQRFARHTGLAVHRLDARQAGYWLTPGERAELPWDEQVARLLVRTARLDTSWTIWPGTLAEADGLLDAALDSARQVREAAAVNASVQAADPSHDISRLDPARIAAHLDHVWRLDAPDAAVRDAAARDRAFRDHACAVRTARYFYLAATGVTVSSAARGASVRART